jgi:hypothetical protein
LNQYLGGCGLCLSCLEEDACLHCFVFVQHFGKCSNVASAGG